MDNENQNVKLPSDDTVVTFGELKKAVADILAPELAALRSEFSTLRTQVGDHIEATLDTLRSDLSTFAQGIEPKLEARVAYVEAYLNNFLTRHFGASHGFDPATPTTPAKDTATQTEETQKNNG